MTFLALIGALALYLGSLWFAFDFGRHYEKNLSENT